MTAEAAPRGRAATAALAARIDAARRSPRAAQALAAMLPEQSPLFAGRGTNEAERLRGYVLASFEDIGLPAEAMPFVLEELETGRNPYTVAAAARALRGAADVAPEVPGLLVDSIMRLRDCDESVSFEQFDPLFSGGNGVTALAELARALAWLGHRASSVRERLEQLIDAEGASFAPAVRAELVGAVRALERTEPAHDCCHAAHDTEPRASADPTALTELADLRLENQEGDEVALATALGGRVTALAFFYTRCNNPDKCSLTVTRLGSLARRLAAAGIDANVAGITYDPGFDRPPRLRRYGAERGMSFSPRCVLLRTVGPFDPLARALELGVGFGPTTVNRHRLDLVVLDPTLTVAERFERRLWNEERVLEAMQRVLAVA